MSHGFAIVKPKLHECKICSDMSMSCNAVPECNNCPREQTVEILQFVQSSFSTSAVCKTKEGKFIDVEIKHLISADKE